MSELSNLLSKASLTLDDVLSELRQTHYIVQRRGRIGCPCTPTMIDLIARDFISTYETETEMQIDDIDLSATGTDDGQPGNFTYAVFNRKKVDLEEIHQILKWVNILDAAQQTTDMEIAKIDQVIAAKEDAKGVTS